MTHTERLDLSLRHELEVRQVIDLANVVAMYHSRGSVPDVVEDIDFFSDVSDPDMNLHPSVKPLGKFVAAILDESDDHEEVLEYLSQNEKHLGFYLQVAFPMIREGNVFSWGLSRLNWVFGNTYEEAFKIACDVAKEQGHDYD